MKQMYAIAYMKKGNLDFAYVRAESIREAENTFRVATQKQIIRRQIQIVSVGPAVGAHALDDNGDKAVM